MQEQNGTAQVEQLGGWYKTPKGEMKFYKGDGYGNDFKASGIKGDFQGEVWDGTGKVGLHYRPDGKVEKNGLIISGGGKSTSHTPSIGKTRAINPVENPKPITKEPVSTVAKSVTSTVPSNSENKNSFVTWEGLKSGLYTALDVGTDFIPGSGIKDVYDGLKSGNYLQAIDGGLSLTLDAMTWGQGSKFAKSFGSLLEEGTKLLSASVSSVGTFWRKTEKAGSIQKGIVNLTEETFQQALAKGPEKIGDYLVHGTKGIVGNTFNRNIFYVEIPKNLKSLSGFRNFIGSLENEAIESGAKKISIYGAAIINDGFMNPKIATRFGFTFEKSGQGFFLQKTFK